jgi:hypothetical protein
MGVSTLERYFFLAQQCACSNGVRGQALGSFGLSSLSAEGSPGLSRVEEVKGEDVHVKQKWACLAHEAGRPTGVSIA